MTEGRVVVITGASGGIGAALAQRLGGEGHTLVLVARRAEALAEVARQAGGRSLVVPADVTDRAEVRRVIAGALDAFGRIDVWVNNVGQGITRRPSELTDDDIDQMMRLNVLTALYGMQEILPHFAERGGGQIVNISSMLGRIPLATFRSAYCGAKHFLDALTATFRAELLESHPGIQVSLVSPGVVYTDFGRNAVHGGPDSRDLPAGQSADEVAEVIAGVIAQRRADVYTRAGSHDGVVDYYAGLGEDP